MSMRLLSAGLVMVGLLINSADAAPFAQLSSSESQTATTAPKVITLNSTDAAKGIENKAGVVTIKEAGTYFAIAAGQVGATAAGGKGSVRLWMRQNGKDIDNSNTEQTVSGSTAVLVCQGVGEFKAGDTLELVQAATGEGVGMLATKPKGEPAIPSMILSVFKVEGTSFAQVSSGTTQMATTDPKAIAMNSLDATKGVENKDGVVTITEPGVYFAIAAGQVGGSGKGTVKLWMRQNGKDIDNSNTEQTVSATTSVLVCQGAGEFKAGDKLQLMQSCTGEGVGMVASKPKGEPAVPSMILSVFKVSSKAFAQLSSSKTQAAAGKTISLDSVDAAAGIENKDGVVTIKEGGTYFAIAAGQIGGAAKGTVKLWMRQNGKDIDNSNTEQTVGGTTSVLVCQGVGEFKAGDKLDLMQSATGEGLGMVATKPKGEPAIPSMILTVFRID